MTGALRRAGAGSLLLPAVLLAACKSGGYDRHFDPVGGPVDCCGPGGDPVAFHFLGVGGWLLTYGDEAVLTAPLFSNPGLVETGLTRIHPDTGRIVGSVERLGVSDDLRRVRAVLVGHGHYDHLMDVPFVVARYAPDARVLMGETARIQVEALGSLPGRPWGRVPPGQVVELDWSEAGDAAEPGRWIAVGRRIRVMPLRSDHGPHFAGRVLYSGVRRTPMPVPPVSANQWLEGRTYAFLIDFLDRPASDPEAQPVLRAYYQDAVSRYPAGMPPPDAEVDVALLVPATYAEVDWHPEALVAAARPEHVLLHHWENFFQPPDRPAEPVPFTDLGSFLARLDRALDETGRWWLPKPGARYVFR